MTIAAVRGRAFASLLAAAGLFLATLPSTGANLLLNSGMESGLNVAWTLYGRLNVENWSSVALGTTPNVHTGNNSFKVYAAWNGAPNFSGCYQAADCYEGTVLQASGWMFTPSNDKLTGSPGAGNTAWFEVTFRDTSDNVLALYRSAIFDGSWAPDAWVNLAVTNQYDMSNYTITNTAANLVAPAGTRKVRFQIVLEQDAWQGSGAAFMDDMVLNQLSGPVPPAISDVYPDGSTLFQHTNQLHFTASSSTTDINASGIQVTLNGADVSSQLVVSGTARARNVTLTLKSNQVYTASIRVTDTIAFSSSMTVTFDNFNPNSYIWEGEDYDFGAGQFIDNPVVSGAEQPNSYFGKIGTNYVDYYETDGAGDHLYRSSDTLATTVAGGDVARTKFTSLGLSDYKVGWFNTGEWVNYTRTYPSGKFNVYARVDGGAGLGLVDLSKVTSGQTTSNQTTVLLGSFSFNGRGWAAYDWAPLADSFGNLVTVELNGLATLRATTHGGADLNFFILVPAPQDKPVISGIYPDGTKLLQGTNKFGFTATSPGTTLPNTGIQLTLNGADVSSQLSITGSSLSKTVALSNVASNRAYTAVITVTDMAGNSSSQTVKFDTFKPVVLWEGEDWDFDSGQFFDNPVLSSTEKANSYFGKVGAARVDINETGGTPPGSGDGQHQYRTNDVMAASYANDVPRQNFLDAIATDSAIADFATGWFNSGEWVNYTRTFPAGTYNIYGRLANGNSGTANIFMSRVVSGRGTENQTALPLGRFSFTPRGWSSYDYVPLRDNFGNLVTVTLDGTPATFRATAGGANMNFFFLVPARTDLPVLTCYPDGSTLLQGTNRFVFTAASGNTLQASAIHMTLNGADVTSQLTFTGSATSWTGSLPIVPGYTNYTAVVSFTDASNLTASLTVHFDTFDRTSFTWQAEDYDFDGGQYIDNPAINDYFGRVGWSLGGDYFEATPNADATHVYRSADLIGTEVCGDTPLPAYAAAQTTNSAGVNNYDVGWWNGGQWMNYTHNYPAGNYFVYGRLSGGGTFHVQLDKVSATETNLLGTFSNNPRGWALYDYVPLTDANGQRATVALGGLATLRTTTSGNANGNFYLLVPATAPAAPVRMTASLVGSSVVLSFPTAIGSNYKVFYKTEFTDATWTLLTMVAGDGTVRSISDSTAPGKRFYRLVIE